MFSYFSHQTRKEKKSTIDVVTKLSPSKRANINVTQTGPKLKKKLTITGAKSNNNTRVNITVSD